MDLQNSVLKFTCDLYSNLNISRSNIQFIVQQFQTFITTVYNPFLLKQVNEGLNKAVDEEVSQTINKIFDKYKDPFIKYGTEDKRLRLLEKMGLYVMPETVSVTSKEIITIHLPLKNSLKKLFSMDGLFKATMSYINFLHSESTVKLYFIQGTL